ncbi:hypothetical protein NP493_806g01009 [Ridgeia piscesae]|uniref:LamG-like jellyroll fold domain-containing protein n=1 Tax=Ridgeia piscesae TaxID=27915 RepID=A0AAD9NLI0_RIDPI|nr:hypothetical protein NP493_806g01009 [Ridgeia piscesae]
MCPVEQIIPSCSDDLLLYFPYEDHYNDVTCHHAIATQYGSDVSIVAIAFLRTWFAENNVDKFSVAVWFQRAGALSPKAAIVNNRNCKQTAGFSVSYENSQVTGSITVNSEVVLDPLPMADNEWHHAAWVYDGQTLQLYIDGKLKSHDVMTGFMQNNDVPMRIASNCDDYFVGCLDELRVYSRVFTLDDINNLRNLPQ